MSLEIGVELPPVKTVSELQTFFQEEAVVDFVKNTLSRSARMSAVEQGVELGVDASAYLFGDIEEVKHSPMFVIGHLAEPGTRAVHILHHAGFRWFLDNTEGIVFDQITRSYQPTILSPNVVKLGAYPSTVASRALYELPEHHDLAGNPGVISYVVPEVKAQYDQVGRTRLLVAEAAKSLIAQA